MISITGAVNLTIDELEKRIAELEADRTNLIELMQLKNDFFCKLVTAERKRREECEAALQEVAGAPNRIAENSRIIADYFSRYKECL